MGTLSIPPNSMKKAAHSQKSAMFQGVFCEISALFSLFGELSAAK